MSKKVAKVVTAPVKAVGKVVKTVAPSKPKAAPAPVAEARQIQGRDPAAERAAARRKARMQGGGLLSGVSYIGTEGSAGGLPQLGETGLGIRKSDLGYPLEV
jgi:hypothetical protein